VGTKAANTRGRLLDAAAQVLGQRGYAGTRMGDVGDVAGVQAAAIYYHFSNKEELAGEVFREGLVRSRQNLQDALARVEGAGALERLAVAIESHVRLGTEQSAYTAAAALRRTGEVPPSVQARCRPDERAYSLIWRGLLLDVKSAGVLRPDTDLMTAQTMLLGALNAIAYSWKPGRQRIDEVVATALQMMLNGLSAAVDDH
jgi:AcrR family transcriptional regulator